MLRIENVFKNYGKLEVLKGISFNVKEGEIKALIGVNGAGKTTLIELICGVKPFDFGKIYIQDNDISNKSKRKYLKKLIGYMPQTFSLFNDLTVKENLGYLCSVYNISKTKANEIINLCNLQNHKDIIAKNLSGGYRQLLSLASAIIHSPKMLILDEPTSAMDPIFRRKFWEIIDCCRENGMTIFVITHFLEELLECDSFICLSQGEIKFDGKVKDFKKNGFIDIKKIVKIYANG